ncbi:MAG: amidohydrolase family protein [Actinobacteria bacterium]|nr:amidohydrolase family protein [Actinomycetota bacterium]
MTQHDLVIRNGTIVDGTGRARFQSDLAIDDGVITAIGEISGQGSKELDATGLLVTPGWVDIHTHYDGQVSWDPYLTPSSWQGVTTAVMGNCGVGFAPVAPDRHDWLIEVMEGIEDIPGTALHEGITWEWESFPEYLDSIDSTPHAIDFAAQIGHAAVRGYVMGDRGADHAERATPDEIAQMGAIAADAIRAGALGFTTSRTVAHKSADGRHTPSLTASREELVGIARAIGATGKGVLEIVADLFDLEAEFALIREMAEVSGRPISVSLLQRPEFAPDEYRKILGLIASANEDGLRITGQVAARPVGLIMSLEGRVNPLLPSPTYQSLLNLDHVDRVAALADPSTRATIIAEVEATDGDMNGLISTMFALSDPIRYDQSLDERLDIAGAYDTLMSDNGNGRIYVPVMNFVEGNLKATREMIAHPNTVPGLGDAGAHCTMICDASFPTWMLQYWGRDVASAEQFEIEWLVKQQTHDTAHAVGLDDRGTLEQGKRADINLIDFELLSVGVPEMLHDLPANGKRLVQRAAGYRSTIVAGSVVMNDGVPTGELPGRLIRGAQSSPKA